MKRTVSRIIMRERVRRWLRRHPEFWRGLVVERYEPMRVSDAWAAIARELKRCGIYSPNTEPWDMALNKYVRQVQVEEAA